MGLRFFADHCIPSIVIRALEEEGHEVLPLRHHIPIDSSDRAVISVAQKLDSILISLNGDFADTLNYPPADYRGIIALQVRNHPEILPELTTRLNRYLSLHSSMSDYSGKLVLVEVHRIRIRG
jgi:predicted nuclease of predicted toxin-antitoxin system